MTWRAAAVAFSLAALGCAESSHGVGPVDGGMDGSGGAGANGGSGGGSGGFLIDAGDAGGSPGSTLVYAHTDLTVFSLDPQSPTLTLTQLGNFDCVGGSGQDTSMTDLAVDKDKNIWVISQNYTYPLTIDNQVAHCGTPIKLSSTTGVQFFALTFAPEGVLDPAKEVLVAGNTQGELWAIDAQGNLTLHGNFGDVPPDDGNGHTYASANVGKRWELSGDIVFVENQGSPIGFATVRDCPDPPSSSGCSSINTLIEINVGQLATASSGSVTKSVRGQIVKRAGCNDSVSGAYGNMYGIAAWGAKIYGFSRTGNLVDIDTADGGACLVSGDPNFKFAGAGVTTIAPIVPPPPK